MRQIRGNEIGMIFQEPMTALNPVFTIGRQLTEGLRLHKGMTVRQASVRALELLHQVRIPEPQRRLRQYPHELSGGMRQRVVIAMAMACEPRLLIADEPTTALDVTTQDVTTQAEILALMDRLKRETGAAVILITHDMAVVAQMADRVVVMFRGNKIEEGTPTEIFEHPRHEYTKTRVCCVARHEIAIFIRVTASSIRERLHPKLALRKPLPPCPNSLPGENHTPALASIKCSSSFAGNPNSRQSIHARYVEAAWCTLMAEKFVWICSEKWR